MRPEDQDARDEVWRAQLAQVLAEYRAVTGEAPPLRRSQAADLGAASPWAADGYVGGPTLARIVGVLGPLSPSEVAAFGIATAAALEQLHAVGVVRGDLKPSNILLDERGLGLRPAEFVSAHSGESVPMAEPGGVLDDPGYLAPEQILGVQIGPETDVFALGDVLAYAASGVPPFGGDDPDAVLFRVIHDEPTLDGVPAVLRGLVKACLNKDPAQRPSVQTVTDRAVGVLTDAEAARALVTPAREPFPEELFPGFPEPAPAESELSESVLSESVFPESVFPEATRILDLPPDQDATMIFAPEPAAAAPFREPFQAQFQSQTLLSPTSRPPQTPSAPLPTGPGPRRRGRARSTSLAALGTVAVIGVAAAFLVRAVAPPTTPAAARPSPTAGLPSARLPGTFLAGPGCPASPWASTTESIADNAGLEPKLGGGPPVCGGLAIAFVKSGSTTAGASSFTWTFRLGWSARCTLSVFIANADPSSGKAQYQVFVPASRTATGSSTAFQINQGKAKGQWVAAPALANLALPDGAVQLRLTDAGSFAGDRFHVTASAVRAACFQVP